MNEREREKNHTDIHKRDTSTQQKKLREREITTTRNDKELCSNQQAKKNRNNVFDEIAPTMK